MMSTNLEKDGFIEISTMFSDKVKFYYSAELTSTAQEVFGDIAIKAYTKENQWVDKTPNKQRPQLTLDAGELVLSMSNGVVLYLHSSEWASISKVDLRPVPER